MDERPEPEGESREPRGDSPEPATTPDSFFRRNWGLFKNWILFVGSMGLFVAADQRYYIWVNTVLTEWTAKLTAFSLRLLGLSGRADGKNLWSRICSFEIIGECTAYYPVAIFVSAVIAFPTTWLRKLIGIGVGVPAVLLLNQVRLVSLCYVHHWWPEHFETIHVVVWQSLIVVLTVVLWLVWATTMAGGSERRAT